MKRTAVAVALVVVASLLVGCGSGGGPSSSTGSVTTSLSASEIARQKQEAEAICGRMVVDAHHLGQKAGGVDASKYKSTLEFTTEALIAPALPVIERSARELREVKGEGGERHLDAYVGMFDPILSLLIERVRAGRDGDGDKSHEIEEQLIELGGIQQQLAEEAGLKACTVDLVGSFVASPNS
jgi:hypothetical protein